MAMECRGSRWTLVPIRRLAAAIALGAWAASAAGGEFSFSPTVVAGAPGTVAAPEIEIVFDAVTLGDSADMEVPSVPGVWRWLAAETLPQPDFITYCAVSAGRLQVYLAGTSPSTQPGRAVRACRASVAVADGAPPGQSALPPQLPRIHCFDANGGQVPCRYTPGSLMVGPRDGTASIVYTPSAGSTIDLGLAATTIGLSYMPGSAGDGIEIRSCAISGDAVLRPPILSPQHPAFAGPAAATGSITVQCRGGLAPGTAVLGCTEHLNQAPAVARTWDLRCPESRTPPSVAYGVAPGAAVVLQGGAFSGDPAQADFNVRVLPDGVGSGSGATTSVSSCTTSAGFLGGLNPEAVQAEGSAGAEGWIGVRCFTGPSAQSGTLACEERRGSIVSTRTWPIECPARPAPAIFRDGYEPAAGVAMRLGH